RGPAKLGHRSKTLQRGSPTAPRIGQENDSQQNARADQEEIRAGVPEIINGIKLPRPRVEPAPEHDQENSRESRQNERRGFMRASPGGKHQISERQSRKRKRHPWKHRKKP